VTGTGDVMDDYMFVAACPCGKRTLATKGSPPLCVACLERLFTEPVNQTPPSLTERPDVTAKLTEAP